MKPTSIIATILSCTLATSAHAGLGQLNATCPGGLEIHVDEGGPVYVNGKEAVLKKFNENYFEAKDAASGATISISKGEGGAYDLSYTGKNRANGVCTLATAAPAGTAEVDKESHPVAEKACLAAVAEKTNVAVGKLSVVEALGAEAGIQVTVKVPDADAPWACMTDAKGKPWSVNYTGSEGAL